MRVVLIKGWMTDFQITPAYDLSFLTKERTAHRNSENRNAAITAVENKPITAEDSAS